MQPGEKKKCSLTADSIRQLKELGFVWSTERSKHQKEDWEARLQQLKEYKAKHGDCLVPHGYTEDPSFAEWIHRQRTTHAHMMKEKKPNPVVVERMRRLEELGFHFTVHADKWMEHLTELKEYKKRHGDCSVPTHCAENPQLGRWVHTQRHQRRLQLRGKKSCMTDERAALLNDLGFQWEVHPKAERPRATWDQRFTELKHFSDDYRHFHIPSETMPLLYGWAKEQKQRLRNMEKPEMYPDQMQSNKRIGPERLAALAAIGFTSDVDLGDGDDHSDVSAGHHSHPSYDHSMLDSIMDPLGFVHDHHDHEHASVDMLVGEPIPRLPDSPPEVMRPGNKTGDCNLQAAAHQPSDNGPTDGTFSHHGMAVV